MKIVESATDDQLIILTSHLAFKSSMAARVFLTEDKLSAASFITSLSSSASLCGDESRPFVGAAIACTKRKRGVAESAELTHAIKKISTCANFSSVFSIDVNV